MNRTGLIVVLVVAAVGGVVFGVFPELDLRISGWFFDPGPRIFVVNLVGPDNFFWINMARDISMWIIAALAAPAVVALIGKLIFPRAAMVIPGRAVVYLLLTL